MPEAVFWIKSASGMKMKMGTTAGHKDVQTPALRTAAAIISDIEMQGELFLR